jgi:hypothetical protein
LLVIISASAYLLPKSYQSFPDSFYSTNQDTTTVKNEYMPSWVKEIPQVMATAKVQNLSGQEAINLLQSTPSKTIFSVFLSTQKTIQVNTVYFPGWYAYVNGRRAEIVYNNPRGLINLRLDKGVNNVEVEFKETPVRLLSDLVSIIGFAGLLTLVLMRKKFKL